MGPGPGSVGRLHVKAFHGHLSGMELVPHRSPKHMQFYFGVITPPVHTVAPVPFAQVCVWGGGEVERAFLVFASLPFIEN